jgi:poly(beta-D-mannuronate) C5 epimerase
MKKILLFLSAVIFISSCIAGVWFLWKNKEHYLSSEIRSSSNYLSNYNVSAIEAGIYERPETPDLPDVSMYTLENIKQNIPDFSKGDIQVFDLKKGYPKVRNQLAYYGDLQGRLDPLSIVVLSGVVSLSDVAEEISDPTLIEARADNTFVLHVPLMIKQDASLVIQKGETLLLSANEGVMIPILGDLYVLDATVIGWDVKQDQPAYYKKLDNFRPYFVAWCGSILNVANSYLAHLGYEAPKSYGVSYSSCKNDKYVDTGVSLSSGRGIILNNSFEGLYFGFYSYESEGLAVIGNNYKDNIIYGIDPHDRSKDLIIANNVVTGTKEKHGIIVSREVSDSYIFNNVSEGNAGTGIMMDRDSHHNVIANNIARNNGHDGLAFYESSHNISHKNLLMNNENSGMRIRNSIGIRSSQDVMNANGSHALEMYTQELDGRDIKIDPYNQKASAEVIDAEIVGNKNGVFKLENFDGFTLVAPHIYEAPQTLFSGNLKEITAAAQDITQGMRVESKR